MTTRADTLRRTGWALADQAVSSLSNFALAFVIARSVSTESFGRFGIAFVTYLVALGCSRGLNSDPLVVRFSTALPDRWAEASRGATGGAIAVGVLAGLLCAAVGAALGAGGEVFLALSVSLPGLLLQDAWRWSFIAAGRVRDAFVNDAVWSVMLAPGLVVCVATGQRSPAWFLLAWGAAASGAAIVGVAQAGLMPRPSQGWRWWSNQRDLAGRYMAEFVTTSAANDMSAYGIGSIAGVSAVGSLRAAELLLGPFNVALTATHMVAVPEMARIRDQGATAVRRAALGLSLTLAALTLAWAALVAATPDDLGESLLGDNWASGRRLLIPIAAFYLASALTAGAAVALRALAASRRSLRARAMAAPITIVGSLVGAGVDGARGAGWGWALGNACTTAFFWLHLRAALAEPPASHVPDDGAPSVEDLIAPT